MKINQVSGSIIEIELQYKIRPKKQALQYKTRKDILSNIEDLNLKMSSLILIFMYLS